ncbi:MAG TPA: dihydrodipicolinate synthase family protein [Anaerolineae bacterium]|nr:dihydrodipicolinate synthase family protein [Anaerolineae bacterium]
MLKGVIVAMLTPFDQEGELYEEGVRGVASWLIEKGVHGLFVCGTAGEGMLMSTEQRQRVAEIAVDEVKGRIPVIVHAGALSTAEAIALARHAQSSGAQAAGVVAPPFYPMDHICLVDHFVHVAQAVPDFPVYLYNLPGLAKNDIAPSVVADVCQQAGNVVGIKDSSRDVQRLTDYAKAAPEGFEVIVGSDGILLDGLQAGAVAGVSALASVFPEPVVGVWDGFVSGDLEMAQANQALIGKLRSAVKFGPYLGAYKEALRRRGVPAGYPRSPLRSLSDDEKVKAAELVDPFLAQLD